MSVHDEQRRAFDASFARAIEAPEPRTALVGIQVASTRYLVRLDELHGVAAAGIITPVPSSRPELVGITSQRGRILAVFDLGALLGHPRGPAPAWIVIARGQPIAFAIATLEGHVAVPAAAVVEDNVQLDGVVRPIVPLGRLVAKLVEKEK